MCFTWQRWCEIEIDTIQKEKFGLKFEEQFQSIIAFTALI